MGINLDELRQEHQRLENSGNKNNFLDNFVKMPDGEGTVVVRLLPPRQGGKLYCLTRIHRLGDKTFHSPLTLINGKWEGHCPIQNFYRKLWKDSEAPGITAEQAEAIRNMARAIKPIDRYYYNCIVRSVHDPKTGEVHKNVGPKILSVGKQLHSRIIKAILGDPAMDEPELGDVTSLNLDGMDQSGRDFKIIKRVKKSGPDSFPNYDDSKFMGITPAGTKEEIEKWMHNLHNLEDLRKILPGEELEREVRIFRGLEKVPEEMSHARVETSKPEPIKVTREVVASDEDESLADEDFIRQLKNM